MQAVASKGGLATTLAFEPTVKHIVAMRESVKM
jgi:hypothetical protein